MIAKTKSKCYVCNDEHHKNSKYCSVSCKNHAEQHLAVKAQKQVVEVVDEKIESIVRKISGLNLKYFVKARDMVLAYYWQVGRLVNQEYGKPKEKMLATNVASKGSNFSVSNALAYKGINIGQETLRKARRFADAFPDLVKFMVDHPGINWTQSQKLFHETVAEDPDLLEFNEKVLNNFKKANSFLRDFLKMGRNMNYETAKGEQKELLIKELDKGISEFERVKKQIQNE